MYASTLRLGASSDFEVEEFVFRAALLGTAALAAVFVAWIQLTPPRIEDLEVQVARSSALVMHVPRIALPEPTPIPQMIEPLRPKLLVNPREARARTAPETRGGRRRSLLVQRIGHFGVGGVDTAPLFEENTAELDAALAGVTNASVAELGGQAWRRPTRDSDAIVELSVRQQGAVTLGSSSTLHVRLEERELQADADLGDAEHIRAILRTSQGRFQTCYEQSAKQDPSLGGRVELAWSIVAGRVTDAEVIANNTQSAELAGCMQRAVRTVRFPPEMSAEVARFPWVFTGG